MDGKTKRQQPRCLATVLLIATVADLQNTCLQKLHSNSVPGTEHLLKLLSN